MKNNKKVMMLAIVVIIIIGFVLYHRYNGFKTVVDLENDARKSQNINADWKVVKDSSDTIEAMLFYNEKQTRHTFSVYLKDEDESNYQFSHGGSNGEIEYGVKEFSYLDYGAVLFSMNQKKVTTIEFIGKKKTRVIDLKENEPFAVIVPSNCEEISLYDKDGNSVIIDNVEIR